MNTTQRFSDEIDLREYLEAILKRWKMIAAVTVGIAAAALLLSLFQKPAYEAKTTIMMRSESSGVELGGLAGLFKSSVLAGNSSQGDLLELLRSKAVAAKVLDDLDLTKRIKGWDQPGIKRQKLLEAVSSMLKQPKSTGSLVELKTEADDPQLAADLANEFVVALSYYWNTMNYSQAQNKLKYIESELPRVEGELRQVERKLGLSPRSATGYVSSSQGGLQRDFEIYNSVYIMLRKEYESTKIDASKDLPPFTVIDKAERPLGKSKPKVKLNIMIGLVLGVFSGVFLALGREYWAKSGRS